MQTHLFSAFQTGRQEILFPILRQQRRPQQPPQSSVHPAREGKDLEKNRKEEPGVRPLAGPAWMALVGHGAPPSPGYIQFIYQLMAKSVLSVVHEMSNLGCALSTGFLATTTVPMSCLPTSAKGHHLRPSPRENSLSPAAHPAKGCALVGSENGNCC